MGLFSHRSNKEECILSTSSDESHREQRPLTILLTGSTGNFGSYLLDHLIAQPWIKAIICLNRSHNALSRQLASHQERGLTLTFDKVTFHQADFSAPNLGLSSSTYQDLSSKVGLLIHNAWPVDFNLNFTSFTPSILGVRNLITFCTPNRIKFLFVSSIGATSNFGSAAQSSRSKIPETELTDWKVARTGYGQSKLVSERLLSHASREVGLPVAVVRAGQLGGPVVKGGKWTEREWLPSLVRSSVTLGVIPKTLGPVEDVDWVPVDVAAVVLTELAMHLASKGGTEADFFHLVNPQVTQWSKLVPSITAPLDRDIQLVTFVEWVKILKDSASGFQGVNEGINPAVKLIDFFDNLQDLAIRFPKAKATLLETKKTVQVSKTMAKLGAVSPEWMALWIRQWNWSWDGDAAR